MPMVRRATWSKGWIVDDDLLECIARHPSLILCELLEIDLPAIIVVDDVNRVLSAPDLEVCNGSRPDRRRFVCAKLPLKWDAPKSSRGRRAKSRPAPAISIPRGCRDIFPGLVKERLRRGLTGVSWGMLAPFIALAVTFAAAQAAVVPTGAVRSRDYRRFEDKSSECLARRFPLPTLDPSTGEERRKLLSPFLATAHKAASAAQTTYCNAAARFALPATMRSNFRKRACAAFRRRGSRRKAREEFEPLSRRARSLVLARRAGGKPGLSSGRVGERRGA